MIGTEESTSQFSSLGMAEGVAEDVSSSAQVSCRDLTTTAIVVGSIRIFLESGSFPGIMLEWKRSSEFYP